jgi:thiol-disulfide isomerase/thioredoxin
MDLHESPPAPDEGTPQPSPAPPPVRRWPLGILTLGVVIIIVGGVMLFGGDGDEPAVSVPTLGDSLGLPTRDGEVAADFSIDLFDGTGFRLTDHLATDGRPVVLNLWASWCGPCRAEMPAFDAASREHTDVFFLGVAVEDTEAAARAFADEVAVTYALAFDEDDRVGRRYPSPGLPATFFITSDGTIAKTVFGQLHQEQLDAFIAESFGS